MRFLRFRWLLVAIVALSQTGVSQVAPNGPQASPFDPQDGDTVVFLGDSITHQSLYTQYIENFCRLGDQDRVAREPQDAAIPTVDETGRTESTTTR